MDLVYSKQERRDVMIEYDYFKTSRKIDNQNMCTINYNDAIGSKLKQCDSFIEATTQVIYLMS